MGLDEILNAVPNQGMRDSVERYLVYGIPPGGFMTAVLTDSLKNAVGRADMNNRRLLIEWAEWLYNYCPAAAQGSEEAVIKWIESGGFTGKLDSAWSDQEQQAGSPSS